MQMDREKSITLAADYSVLKELREFVSDIGRLAGLDDAELDALSLAVDEAATNIISHTAPDAPHKFSCTCSAHIPEHELVCKLSYDAEDLFAPIEPPSTADIQNRVQSMKRGGLGVYLMHTLVDEVDYRREGIQNVICLVKRVHDDSGE
jgi:serine/threonine-protein kinase RsbW